jgi:hypothetical protein
VLVAGQADGGDPGGALMDQNAEKKQMQRNRDSRVFWVAAGCCYWFADGVDLACSLLCDWYFVEAG